MHDRREFCTAALAAGTLAAAGGAAATADTKAVKYARFRAGGEPAYGIVEGDRIRRLTGDLFGHWERSEQEYPLDAVELLAPARPTQVFAMAGNYRSHLKD